MGDKLKILILNLSWLQVVLGIMLSAAAFYLALDQGPLINRRESLVEMGNQIGSNKKKIEEAKKFEQEFEQRKKVYAEMVKQFQQMQGALPKQFFVPDVLNDIVTEAKNVDVDIINLKPDPREERRELYSTLGVTLEARGTFLQMLVFLDRLANMKRLVGVATVGFNRDSDLSLAGADGRPGTPGLRARVRILTYRYGS